LFFLSYRYGSGRTGHGALHTGLAEGFHTQIHRFVGYQGHVRLHGKKAHAGPEPVGNEVAQATHFSETCIYGKGHQDEIVMTVVLGHSPIAHDAKPLGQDGGDIRSTGIIAAALHH
jgi:hypothetical protein